jgi:hypothetical protein
MLRHIESWSYCDVSNNRGLTMNAHATKVNAVGVVVVKRSEWSLLLFVVIAVIFVSVVPFADNPETAFNESDTPVHQTTPISPWVNFAFLTRVPIITPKSFGRAGDKIRRRGPISLPTRCHLSPLRELLCTLLI